MKIVFAIPTTPKTRVEYIKGGTKYAAVIDTPSSADGLINAMLIRQVGMSQVKSVEPIQPRGDFQWGHPVRVDKFAKMAEHS